MKILDHAEETDRGASRQNQENGDHRSTLSAPAKEIPGYHQHQPAGGEIHRDRVRQKRNQQVADKQGAGKTAERADGRQQADAAAYRADR